uniref:Uncharacterized protein n=1 Tax=Arundo donax TaxID=35708 RepID=A0A0A9CD03_ARUDO
MSTHKGKGVTDDPFRDYLGLGFEEESRNLLLATIRDVKKLFSF